MIQRKLINFFHSLKRKQVLMFLGVLLLLVAVILFFSLRPGPDPMESAEIAAILDRGVLRVGVRNDIPGFSSDTGGSAPEGFEVELAELLAERIFGEEGHLELTVVNFNTMPAKLRSSLLDCAIAIAQKDMSPSLSYSNAYYDDAVAIMVRADSAVTEPHQLAGLTVGCINRDGTNQRYTCRNVLNSFASGLSPAAKVVEYSAIPDMIADLADGTIDAVCLEYALLYSYYSPEGHRILSEAIGTISYAVALPSGSSALAEIANELIAELRASGELQAMLTRWALQDYSAS